MRDLVIQKPETLKVSTEDGDRYIPYSTHNRIIIMPEPFIIDEIIRAVKDQRKAIIRRINEMPAKVIVSLETYKQILVYVYNIAGQLYPDKFLDLIIDVDPTLDGYQVRVLCSNKNELLFESELKEFKRTTTIVRD